jgi:hypothetical protein
MNKIHIFALAIGTTLAFSSCSDFLDVQPGGNPTTTTYFSNDQQSIDAIDALYQPLVEESLFGREIFWEQGGACDVVWGRTRSYPTLATFGYTGDESPLRGTFNQFYTLMARSNFVIKKLLDKQKSTTLTAIEKRSLGEAFFMRGFSHFWIAHRYGTADQGVPFVRWEDYSDNYNYEMPPQQASVVDNYKYIIEDMDNAIQYLPKFEEYGSADKGRAHQAAAVALKAKTYAYWATWDESQWKNVVTQVDLLQNTYNRALAPSLDTVFSADYANFWNSEYIFALAGDGGTKGGGSEFPGVILDNGGWGKYNGWGQNKPSYDIYEEMLKDGENNARMKRSLLKYGDEFKYFGETMRFYSTRDIEAGFMINKYMEPFGYEDATKAYVNPNGDWPTARVNMPLMRYAEMLLFRAEAYLMMGGADNAAKATADINAIRNRSGLAPLSGTATMKDLYHERRCELAFEFTNHLFDLKRWARSSNAEIKALALAELNAHPRVRHYTDRSNPDSPCTVGAYEDYKVKNAYQDYMMVFPYPSEQVTKYGGQLKQNAGYK